MPKSHDEEGEAMTDWTQTCEGPMAHIDIWEGRCPRCGVLVFRRHADESDEDLRERIKATLVGDDGEKPVKP